MTRYITLLRGINVGGNKKIKMADLREMLTNIGFANVKTALASGNVAFDSDETDTAKMRENIMQTIESTFGFEVPTQVFPRQQVENLVTADPFVDVEVTDNTRLYVTFLPEPPQAALELPYHTPDLHYTILRVTETDVCSVLTLSNKGKTPEFMKILEQHFGKTITTRTWKTTLKIAAL